MTENAQPKPSLAKMLIDFGPIVVFFTANALAKKLLGPHSSAAIFWATGAFVIATVAAMLAARVRDGRIPGVLWLTGIIVVVFGVLTIYLHDERFIKIKPTIYNGLMALFLLGGLLRGKSLIKMLLGEALPPLNDYGWRILTWRWAGFFAFSALLNEYIWRNFSTQFWLNFKLADFALTMIFAAANMPFLLKHELRDLPPPEKPYEPS